MSLIIRINFGIKIQFCCVSWDKKFCEWMFCYDKSSVNTKLKTIGYTILMLFQLRHLHPSAFRKLWFKNDVYQKMEAPPVKIQFSDSRHLLIDQFHSVKICLFHPFSKVSPVYCVGVICLFLTNVQQ